MYICNIYLGEQDELDVWRLCHLVPHIYVCFDFCHWVSVVYGEDG